MDRITQFDVARRRKSRSARIGAQMAFGVGCALASIALRGLVDIVAPTAGPFALIYPPVLIATLYGRLLAGICAELVAVLWAWWFVLPPQMSFRFAVPTDPSRLLLNVLSVTVVMLLAEAFRRAVHAATQARDAEIAHREMLLSELEHRTRNNFALVSSLLSLQGRRHEDPAVREALELAKSRVDTFARAYEALQHEDGHGALVPMAGYVHGVVSRVSAGVFAENVTLHVAANDTLLPHRQAVAIGLFINEALTNCAKYAFPDARPGQVSVAFEGEREAWTLSVSDDGIGSATAGGEAPAGSGAGSGMGHGLMGAFARQAEAQYEVSQDHTGRTVTLQRG